MTGDEPFPNEPKSRIRPHVTKFCNHECFQSYCKYRPLLAKSSSRTGVDNPATGPAIRNVLLVPRPVRPAWPFLPLAPTGRHSMCPHPGETRVVGRPNLCTRAGMPGRSSMHRSSTGCVRVRGGSLPCPEVGRVGSSYVNRSVTGCVPVPSSGLPGPRYVGVGISNANRSVTGCVLAPGSDRPGPGVGGIGISYENRLITGCVPVPGSDLPGPGVLWVGSSCVHRFGLAPLRGPSRRDCPGSGVSADSARDY